MKTALLPKISLRMVREPGKDYKSAIVTPSDVGRYLEWMKDEAQEIFVAVLLDTKMKPIGCIEISRGTLNASLVHPREVFKGALLANAHAIIVAHNHPTGDTKPSAEDKEVTKTLTDAGKILHVQVLDHLIIGDDVRSIREDYPHLF